MWPTLRRQGVSYIFGSVKKLDFKTMLDKLGKLFSVKTILLAGGGYLNGSLPRAGLVHELSLLPELATRR